MELSAQSRLPFMRNFSARAVRGFCLLLALCSASVSAQPRAKPVDLLNGRDLTGWEFITLPAAAGTPVTPPTWSYKDTGVLSLTGKPVSYLATTTSHSDYRLHVEWRWPADAASNSNSGILLHIASGPTNDSPWPVCLQVQLKLGRAGDLLPMATAKFAEPLTSAPGAKNPQRDRLAANSERAPGEWNSCDIVCRGGAIDVTVNGVLQNRITGCVPSSGRIGLQLEGTPYELRNIRLLPPK